MGNVTEILEAAGRGDRQAAVELLPLVYQELRRLAAKKLEQEPSGQTLQATALVHEAYLRLIGPANAEGFEGRRHFFGAAAEAMRRILIEAARRRGRAKNLGGSPDRMTLEGTAADPSGQEGFDLVELNDALDRLSVEDPAAAEVVKLRFFAGLTIEQAAETLGASARTVNRHWAFARAWLFQELQ